ncbi:MAG TPA: hypothetical protein P5318_19070 [Candidatus Hydrogenedentes bacterium]|nr:hypothetical protein [Candidatus Hydrogenedentota bacterium]HRT22217.1 hypothetical protein [Candidatus Hydrogenedentota bacterium]HRT67044.1 hypothetical protein [Candidatus Hydrogenedentota bacterium]
MADASKMFVDAFGREWHPKFTTRVIRRAAQMTGFQIGQLMAPANIKLSDLIDVAWYMCEDEAKERRISQDDFFDQVIPPPAWSTVFPAIWEIIADAWPASRGHMPDVSGSGAAENPTVPET